MKRAGVMIGLLLALAALALLAACIAPPAPESPESLPAGRIMPEVRGAGTVWPVAAAMTPAPGVVSVRDFRTTITPNAMLSGVNRQYYANTVQPNLTATPNFSNVETQAAYMDSLGSAPLALVCHLRKYLRALRAGWRADCHLYRLQCDAPCAGLWFADLP